MELLEIELFDGAPPRLRVEGEIDLATADQLEGALTKTLSEHPDVVVDLAGVSFLGADGIRVLLGAARSLNGSGPLKLVHAERVAWLLRIVGLDEVPAIEFAEARAGRG